VKVGRKSEGDGMKTMREVNGRMQGDEAKEGSKVRLVVVTDTAVYGMTCLRALFHRSLY